MIIKYLRMLDRDIELPEPVEIDDEFASRISYMDQYESAMICIYVVIKLLKQLDDRVRKDEKIWGEKNDG